MLFNSYDFIFGLLPLTLVAHHYAIDRGPRASTRVLVVASMVFYGWWYWPYLGLFLASILFNFMVGNRIGDGERTPEARDRALKFGITANLLTLGFFKYLAWLVNSATGLIGLGDVLPVLSLPVGISFFTFQQIAWLVDTRKQSAQRDNIWDYALFVSFFPQLIAGPIVHHGEIMPQLAANRRPDWNDRAVGFTMFSVGLAKKLLIADALAPFVEALYGKVHAGALDPTVFEAWQGLLAWHFQLYFDFSGYSDMALGLGRMFGVKLPVNFEAPYRATSMLDFWRRWHLTLTRFLRDYLYVPLGGNKVGGTRYLRNLFLTIFLAGIWHGAGWTYLLWGLQMGVYQVINAWWVQRGKSLPSTLLGTFVGRVSVWLCLLFSWPLFRGQTVADAGLILQATVGANGAGLGQPKPWLWSAFALCTAIVTLLPTLQQVMREQDPAWAWRPIDTHTGGPRWAWKPTLGWAVVTGLLFAASIPVMDRANAFLYWNF
jgi:D-alanyl-lipoteichoic acid acyltransferase DltB (MBOAT superfamily)